MPSPDELRQMIQRVDAAGGPLCIELEGLVGENETGLDYSLGCIPDNHKAQDHLSGVLRRDLERVAQTVKHEMWPGAMAHQRHIVVVTRGDTQATGLAATSLHAHLDCWLDAHAAGLVGRQEATINADTT